MKDRSYYQRANAKLNPDTDYLQIFQNLTFHDFPWDMNQALNLALFRTYGVPSIGSLLLRTRQLTEHTQKRYDDTALLLEIPLKDGLTSPTGRAAIRRINQMHGMYDISQGEMLYVLSTFVVVPVRWIRDYGWRKLLPQEEAAITNVYRELGRLMGIQDIPETYEGFAHLMDSYEAAHFAFDAGGRKVADATLRTLEEFYPAQAAPAVSVMSRAVMDEPLLEAFRYDDPGKLARTLVRGALRLRAEVVKLLPPKESVAFFSEGNVKSYSNGFRIEELGTFKHPKPGEAGLNGAGLNGAGPNLGAGCPFPHGMTGAQDGHKGAEA
ncbi:oxygenase MpaB family protein [Deinococcus wulumuqiensis]|uniref:Peptidase n=1 Tax=Deinococcus wulumuqiensis TaxID=980427 RepID=A0AAV4KBE1_9DEIO|nr:oxygenase MpaB family protein [Deinococcus wulumuqiensis]GGI68942.1 peptidase [Deinococcus wulumuqiensis]GGI94585.1 peptidase [Deinococcus wulumuqiensis]